MRSSHPSYLVSPLSRMPSQVLAFGGDRVLQLLRGIEERIREFEHPPIGPVGMHLVSSQPHDAGMHLVSCEPHDVGMNLVSSEPHDVGMHLVSSEPHDVGMHLVSSEPPDVGMHLVICEVHDTWITFLSLFEAKVSQACVNSPPMSHHWLPLTFRHFHAAFPYQLLLPAARFRSFFLSYSFLHCSVRLLLLHVSCLDQIRRACKRQRGTASPQRSRWESS